MPSIRSQTLHNGHIVCCIRELEMCNNRFNTQITLIPLDNDVILMRFYTNANKKMKIALWSAMFVKTAEKWLCLWIGRRHESVWGENEANKHKRNNDRLYNLCVLLKYADDIACTTEIFKLSHILYDMTAEHTNQTIRSHGKRIYKRRLISSPFSLSILTAFTLQQVLL